MNSEYFIEDNIPISKIRGTGRKTKDSRKEGAVISAVTDHIQGMSLKGAIKKHLVTFAGSDRAIQTYTEANFRRRVKGRLAEL